MAEDDEPSIGEDLARELAKAIRERDEAREQVRSLAAANETLHGWSQGLEESVRSLTVERDALLALPNGIGRFIHSAAKANAEVDALRARLSRAREALDSAEGVCGICARKLAALRAALPESPGEPK